MIWTLVNYVFKIFGKIYFSNQKKNWKDALNNSKSYEDSMIAEKIIKAYDKINNKNCEFYERDGFIFNQKPDESDLINFLSKHLETNRSLEILDFGGSLGSRFFSNYNFISKTKINWNVVEQQKLVKYGNKVLKKSNLSFYNDLKECLESKKVDCVILSGSLQYIDRYYDLIEYIKNKKIRYVFIDFLPISNSDSHKIFVQNIPKKIYFSSYPIRIFSKKTFIDEIQNLGYEFMELKSKPTVFYGFKYYRIILEKNII